MIGGGALILLGHVAGARIPAFAASVERLGVWAPIAFAVGYVVACVVFVPGSLLTLAAGAIFGLVRGTILVFAAATVGASISFLIARYLARERMVRRLAGNAQFEAIDRAIEGDGFRVVFLLRLSPLVPFSLLNYALGLTRVRFRDFVVASIGMLPGTVLYVYVGTLAGLVATLAGTGRAARGAPFYALWAIGLLATGAVTVVITRRARAALRQATGERQETRA